MQQEQIITLVEDDADAPEILSYAFKVNNDCAAYLLFKNGHQLHNFLRS